MQRIRMEQRRQVSQAKQKGSANLNLVNLAGDARRADEAPAGWMTRETYGCLLGRGPAPLATHMEGRTGMCSLQGAATETSIRVAVCEVADEAFCRAWLFLFARR